MFYELTISIHYIMLSYRIKDDWSFDEAISSQHGCEVQSFDPTSVTFFSADLLIFFFKYKNIFYLYEASLKKVT